MTGEREAAKQRLLMGLDALGVGMGEDDAEAQMAFLSILQKWGQTFNLTAIRDMRAAVDLHLLDSLAISPFLSGASILDVGTGAGLPGIPLAILHKDKQFVLLDSSAKKIRFVRQAVMTLGLKNVEAVAARVEAYKPSARFDVILTRAFAGLPEIWGLTERLLSPKGRMLAMKGRFPDGELQGLPCPGYEVHALTVPGLEAERHLVEMRAE